MGTLRNRSRRAPNRKTDPSAQGRGLLEHRLLDQIDPDARERAIRVYLLTLAQGHSPQLSFHAQCLLAGSYRALYPIFQDQAGLTDQQRQELKLLVETPFHS